MIEIDKLKTAEIGDVLRSLLMYLIEEVGHSQKEIAHAAGYSEAHIHNLKAGKKEIRARHKAELKRIAGAFKIEIHKSEVGFDFSQANRSVDENLKLGKQSRTTWWTTPSTWRIYAKASDKILVRYLKILSNFKSQYIVESISHDNFVGSYRFSLNKSYLVFDLHTQLTGKKELSIRLWIGDESARPSILMGVLTYTTLEGYIVSNAIVATRIQNDVDENLTPQESFVPATELELFIDRYFDLRDNVIYSPPNIISEKGLISYLRRSERQKASENQ